MTTIIIEIFSKLLTIVASPGGLTWLQNHMRNNAEIQARLDQAITQWKELPPPREGGP